jgi:hypothetical protein
MKNSCQTWSCVLLLASVSAAMMACELGEDDAEAIDQTGEALESERLRGTEAIRVSDDPYDTVDGEPYSPERHSTAQIVGVFVHIDDEGIARVHGFTTPQAYDEFMLAWRSELPERDSPPALGHAPFETPEWHTLKFCEHHWPSHGYCMERPTGWYEGNLAQFSHPWGGSWNDIISSAYVSARTHATLYEHIWFGGNWYDFANTSWNNYWYNVDGWFDDAASSFVSGHY